MNAREEAVKVGAEANFKGWSIPIEFKEDAARAVLDAAHKAGLFHWVDECSPTEQWEAMFRLLTSEGHMTPVASQQLRKLFVRRRSKTE